MSGNYTTLLTILLSVGSFALSLYTLWLTQIRRGRVQMTRPTLVFMAREKDDPSSYKIYFRTHLFCTSARGRVIEAMYVRLHNRVGTHLFDLWAYGEAEKLSPGSGLFVGQNGVTSNHHFLLKRSDKDFLYWDGTYRLEIFASVVGNRHALKLMEVKLEMGGQMAAEMVQIVQLGAFFEWDVDQERYVGRIERRD